MKLKLIFLSVLVLIGAVSVFGIRWLVSDHGNIASGQLLTVQGNCQLESAPCEAVGKDQQYISISMTPKPLPLMKPITTQLEVRGFEDIISARFQVEGVNMFMGYQHAMLTASEASIAEHTPLTPQSKLHLLSGSFMLPICSNEVMHWKGTLFIQTRAGLFQTRFPFTTTQAITQ